MVISTPAWPCTDEAVRREAKVRKAGLCERKGEFSTPSSCWLRTDRSPRDPAPHLRQKQRWRLRVGPLREVWFLKGDETAWLEVVQRRAYDRHRVSREHENVTADNRVEVTIKR